MNTSSALSDFDADLRPTAEHPLPFAAARDLIVWAIHHQRLDEAAAAIEALGDAADHSALRLARSATIMCAAVAASISAERARVVALLAADGVRATTPEHDPERVPLHHLVQLEVDPDQVDPTIDLLEADGYTRWQPWRGGAWALHKRGCSVTTLVRDDEAGTRVELRWAPDREPTRVSRLVRPTAADLAVVALPRPLWPLYYAIRPPRLVWSRLRPRPVQTDLGPFLGTPTSLIPGLLELAEVGADDVLFDVGCGDGRVLVEAALRTGCRGVGIERSPEYAAASRTNAERAGVGDRIDIREADGESAGLEGATVVFLFLPAPVVAGLVPVLLGRLAAGVRLIVHEQEPIGVGHAADVVTPIISNEAATVAHLWTVPEGYAGPRAAGPSVPTNGS